MEPLAIALVAVFGTVALVTGSLLSYLLSRRSPVRQRVAALSSASFPGVTADAPRLAAGPDPMLRKLRTYIPKSPRDMNRLQKKLAQSGFHGTKPVVVYCVSEVALALIGFAVPFLVFGRSGMIFGVLGAFVGYMIPSFVLARQVFLRKKQIQNGLPDALDLFIVCLEAGLGIDQAILKAAEELSIAYPALGEELRLVNIETRAGKPRIEAFKNFARRTQVEDVRSLVAMLVQTDRFGTSIAQALRTHAEVSRSKRKQRAEEKAAKLSVKLVFPLVFCLLPAFFVVSLGPAVIKLVNFFSNSDNTSSPFFGG